MCFSKNPLLQGRTRRMLLQAANFKRDTGLDSLYLGFPFLIYQERIEHRPRIQPILLWPVEMELNIGNKQIYNHSRSINFLKNYKK